MLSPKSVFSTVNNQIILKATTIILKTAEQKSVYPSLLKKAILMFKGELKYLHIHITGKYLTKQM